jgi:translation initiation factor IF-1
MQPEGKSRKLLRIHGGDNVLIVVSPYARATET